MRLPLVTAVALAALATPAAPAQVVKRPFPLTPGKQWFLTDGTGTVTRTVSIVRRNGGLWLRGFPGLADTPVRGRVAAVDARYRARWVPFLRLGAPAGTRYLVDLGPTTLWHHVGVTVASRKAVVTDADGRVHRRCIRLTITAPKGGVADAGVEELSFAPGVGLVALTEQTIAGPRRLLLSASGTATR
jgi:hypothetical protein